MKKKNNQITRNIVVDLDGTLIRSDSLYECFFLFIRDNPFFLLKILPILLQGKLAVKHYLAKNTLSTFDPSTLPYNQPLLKWLKQQKKNGAQLTLATASSLYIANNIAKHLKIFDIVIGSKDVNLSAENKRDKLVSIFGMKGFEYIGNSKDDIPIWKASSLIHTSNLDFGVNRLIQKIGITSQAFITQDNNLFSFIKLLRPHQWIKNILVFLPMVVSHKIGDIKLLQQGFLAFLSFSMCASSVYILNDLLDLQNDRKHTTKKFRSLASGEFKIINAVFIFAILVVLAFLIAFLYLPLTFLHLLFTYFLITSFYSFYFKKIAILDVVILALLYTLRVIAGAEANGLTSTFWMLDFCFFIFLSLAFLKRYTELFNLKNSNAKLKAFGRGYYSSDFELLASLGASSGYLAILILGLYINEQSTSNLYNRPLWLWPICPLLIFWISRTWLIAHRGQMQTDPVLFALKDRISRFIFIFSLLFFMVSI